MAISSASPRTLPPREPLDVDAYFALDTEERYELYDGMLIMAPSPDSGHSDAGVRISAAFFAAAMKVGGTVLAAPINVVLSRFIAFEPDVLYVAPGGRARVVRRGVDGPPDIVVEVMSPSTRRYDEHTKLPAYLEHGVREVWLVDQIGRKVTVHTRGAPPVTVAFGGTIPTNILDVADAYLASVPMYGD